MQNSYEPPVEGTETDHPFKNPYEFQPEGIVYVCELTDYQVLGFIREVLGQISRPLTKRDLEFLARGRNKELWFEPLKTKVNFRKIINGIQVQPMESAPLKRERILRTIDQLAIAYFKKQGVTEYRRISEIEFSNY